MADGCLAEKCLSKNREQTAASTLTFRGADGGEAAGRGRKRRGRGAVQVGKTEDVSGTALGVVVGSAALAGVVLSTTAAAVTAGGGRGGAAAAAVLGRVGGHSHGDAGEEGDDEGLDLHVGITKSVLEKE